MELGALLICWLVYWCGLLLYLGSLHKDTAGITVTSVLLTTIVIVGVGIYNVIVVYFFVLQMYTDRQEKRRSTLLQAVLPQTKSLMILKETLHQAQLKAQQQLRENTETEDENSEDDENNFSTSRIYPATSSGDGLQGSIDSTIAALTHQFSQSETGLATEMERRERQSHLHVQMRLASRRKVKQTKALTKVPVFSNLQTDVIEELIERMHYKKYSKGDVICWQGDLATKLYIVVTGRCNVIVHTDTSSLNDAKIYWRKRSQSQKNNDDNDDTTLCSTIMNGEILTTLSDLAFFGESCIESNEAQRTATVIVESPILHMLSLSRGAWEDMYDAGDFDDEVKKKVEAVGQKRRERDSARVHVK